MTMQRQAEAKGGILVELHRPEDVRAHLMNPDKHWKDGRSAAELAHAWWDGVPAVVAAILATDSVLADAACERVVFEKRSRMPGAGAATRTDVMAYFSSGAGPVVMAVEGKAGEPFDEIVEEWLEGGTSPASAANRRDRLDEVCKLVGCQLAEVAHLRYQLLVRTAAALGEAKTAGAARALVIVQSFDRVATGSEDFFRFAKAIGAPVREFNRLSPPVEHRGLSLQVAWARDAARETKHGAGC